MFLFPNTNFMDNSFFVGRVSVNLYKPIFLKNDFDEKNNTYCAIK